MKTHWLYSIALLCISTSISTAEVPDFTRDVAPILNKYCVGCHSSDEPEGDLVLESYAGLMTGGENGPTINGQDAAQSLLTGRVTGRLKPVMPPDDEPKPSEHEIETLVRWVQGGANGPDDTTTVRDLDTPKITPSAVSKPITAIAFSPNATQPLIAVARFASVDLIDPSTRRKMSTVATSGKVTGLDFSADGKRLLVATGETGRHGEAMIWDVENERQLTSIHGHRDVLYSARFSPSEDHVATSSYDGRIILWDMATGKEIRRFDGHNGAVYDLSFSPDGQLLASASADATIKVWQVSTGTRLDTMSQPLKEQYAVTFSPDGKRIIAAGEDNRIRMWELVSIEKPKINPLLFARFAHEGAVRQIAYAPDRESIVSVGDDDIVKIWTARDLKQIHSFPHQPDNVQALAISINGEIAVGRMNGSFEIYPEVQSAPKIATAAISADPIRHSQGVEAQTTLVKEVEPNNFPDVAQDIAVPMKVTGTIHATDATDEDLFRISVESGQAWIIEVRAAQNGSDLDSHVSVLTPDGEPVPRVQLQAVRDSYFTFRGKDSSTTGDFRLHNWEEMTLNQFLYCTGEVVKLYHYPRGPDSGFNVYPNFGDRRGYFDTTPLAHPLHENCYIVEPHPPSAQLAPNGLPVFILNYENDDDSQRRMGRDSQLTFVAPQDGNYLVRIRDVRGLQGEDYKYELAIRQPKPDFRGKSLVENLKVGLGSARKFGVEVERVDGFDGPINVEVRNLPTGFSVAGMLTIEAGHDRAWGSLMAANDAEPPSAEAANGASLIASAIIEGQRVERELGAFGEIELDASPSLFVALHPDKTSPSSVSGSLPVIEVEPGGSTTATIKIVRQGYEGRVNFGKEDGAVNSPHGVYVDNSGLNGVLIVEGQNERQFYITAEPWVQPMERLIFVEAAEAGTPASAPVLFRVLSKPPSPGEQASR